jgi:hypothetical protein
MNPSSTLRRLTPYLFQASPTGLFAGNLRRIVLARVSLTDDHLTILIKNSVRQNTAAINTTIGKERFFIP